MSGPYRLFITSLGLSAFLVLPSVVSGQVYFDLPVQFDFYRTNNDDLHFERRGAIFNPVVGAVILGNDSADWEMHIGFGLFVSKFNQIAGETTFKFRAIGPVHSALTVYRNVDPNWQVG